MRRPGHQAKLDCIQISHLVFMMLLRGWEEGGSPVGVIQRGGGRVEKRISRGKTRARREFTAIRIYRDGNGRAQYRSTDGNRSLERPEPGGRCG